MANKEKIDYLLLDIRQLETMIAGMRDAEIYPVSFFSQTFDLTHKILNDLHSLEATQIEVLRKQMEAHQALIVSLPEPVAAEMPKVEEAPVERKVEAPMPEVKPAPEVKPMPEVKPTETIVVEAKETKPEPVAEVPIKETPLKTVGADKPGVFLSDVLEKKNLSDLRKAFSLNDRFRFRRELFGGDEEKMNKAIADLSDIQSYEASVEYLNNELKWNVEDEAVADFLKLLEKRFL